VHNHSVYSILTFVHFVSDESVENLAGPADLIPIFRPIEFTLVPDKVCCSPHLQFIFITRYHSLPWLSKFTNRHLFYCLLLQIRNFHDVSFALRHTDQLCTLMSYQTETIKNTYMLRVALIQHVFTQVRVCVCVCE